MMLRCQLTWREYVSCITAEDNPAQGPSIAGPRREPEGPTAKHLDAILWKLDMFRKAVR